MRFKSPLVLTSVAAAALAFSGVTLPVMAHAQSTTAVSKSDNGSDAPTGSLNKSHNDWRTSKLVGATVYNEQGNEIGTIDDLLTNSDGSISDAVLSVGGFIGIGNKLVEVPFSKLKFEPSKSNSASSNASNANGSANDQDYSVVLQGATKESLKDMSAFSF